MMKLNNEHSELLQAMKILKIFCFNKPDCIGCPLRGEHACVLRERPAANLPIIKIAHDMEELEESSNG